MSHAHSNSYMKVLFAQPMISSSARFHERELIWGGNASTNQIYIYHIYRGILDPGLNPPREYLISILYTLNMSLNCLLKMQNPSLLLKWTLFETDKDVKFDIFGRVLAVFSQKYLNKM